MQYEANRPEEYFELLEDDWRKEKLMDVRRIILEYAPELEESICYKMLCYGNESVQLFSLNVQKSYVSLYVGTIGKVENSNILLDGFDCGKGCIRIKKSIKILTGLETFIKRTIDIWRAGGDTSC